MLGHDMSWAAFHVIEVMSQDRFSLKRTGFLAAAQSFTATTDVLVLCVQLLKKEFTAKSAYEIGTAINTLSCIATEDLSRDLLGDVVQMLTSSRVYIRKKATLVLFKLYCMYPQGLRLTFDNLKRRLGDEAPAVACCAVNVIAELARKKPSNYLSLAPEFFGLLTGSTNNWMLIKVVKLMGSLVPEEPRLARKLLEPLANIIQTSTAKSLMYEAIHCMTLALQHTKKPDGTDAKNVPAVVRLCTDRLRELVREPDQNLKYLGLVGLVGLMKSHPRVVAEHRELVLACLLDEDTTIRFRALELVCGMCTRRNLPDIVNSLMGHLDGAEGHYRDELIAKIIFMCSRDKYAYLADFGWYVEVLAKLAYLPGSARHATTVAGQLLDVAVRVEDVRPTAMTKLIPMLADHTLLQNARGGVPGGDSGGGTSGGGEGGDGGGGEGGAASAPGPGAAADTFSGAGSILYAAAWIVGEFCAIIPPTMHSALLDALLGAGVSTLPAPVQSAYVQCVLKVLSAAAGVAARGGGVTGGAAFLKLAASVLDRLNPFAQSLHVEVQERAFLVQRLLATLGVPFTPPVTSATLAAEKAKADADLLALAEGGDAAAAGGGGGGVPSPSKAATTAAGNLPPLEADLKVISGVLASLFAEALKPVNSKAQKRVPVPAGLDLDAWIVPSEAAAAEPEDKRFMTLHVSFEDSYGVDEEEEGAAAPAAGGKKKKGKKYDTAGGDDDDDAWLESMAKKNKKRDAELWGASDDEEEKPKKSAKGKGGKGGKDPFLLGGGGGGGGSRARAGTEEPDIPIRTLAPGELGGVRAGPALDVSIFGDFAKKEKSKKGTKGAKEAPQGRTFRVASDEDFPVGGGADDEEGEAKEAKDALSNIDLSTPLGEDERLPERRHRSVQDPAALRAAGSGKKGGGRARVLVGGGGGGEEGAAPAKEEKKKKGGDKEKEEAKKPKKAAVEEEKPKKKKGDAAPPAAAAPEKAKKEKKSKAAPPPPDFACEDPFAFPLAADKMIKLSFALTAAAPSAPAADGGGGGGEAAAPASGVVQLCFFVEAKSSKKTVEWVDVAFVECTGGAAVDASGASAGGGGGVKLISSLKPKEKGAPPPVKKSGAFPVAFPAAFPEGGAPPPSVAVRVTYRVEGSEKVVTLEGALLLRAASLLVATPIEPNAYKALMTGETAVAFGSASLPAALLPAGPDATLKAVLGTLRAAAVARSPKHAILFARTAAGLDVTVVVRVVEDAEEDKRLLLQAKSKAGAAHAEALLADVAAALKAVVDAAKKGKDDE
jgi:AP-3 complex subunit delta-1